MKPDMTAILCLNTKDMAQNRQPRQWQNILLWSAGSWEFKGNSSASGECQVMSKGSREAASVLSRLCEWSELNCYI